MADEELEGASKPYDVGYDESEMSDSDVSRNDFEFSPEWARDKFSKLAYQRKQERQRADKEAGRAAAMAEQNAQLAQRLAALESRVGSEASPPKEKTIEDVSDSQLREYKTRAYGWLQASNANPGDDTAKAEVAKIDFAKLALVDEELARRAAVKPVQDLKNELAASSRQAQQNSVLTNKLRLKFGDEVLDMTSPLMTRAAEIAKEIAAEFGLERLDAGASVLAVERAHAEMRRNSARREMSERDRQRLSLEAGSRREASISPPSPRKGDWKAQVAYTESNIDRFLDGMGLPRD